MSLDSCVASSRAQLRVLLQVNVFRVICLDFGYEKDERECQQYLYMIAAYRTAHDGPTTPSHDM